MTSTCGTRNCLLVLNVLRLACRRSSTTGRHVLSVNDALEKLRAKTLSPCSVVLTFDDGGCDFYRCAFPILRQFNWPATVYLKSYYSHYTYPLSNWSNWQGGSPASQNSCPQNDERSRHIF